MEADSPAFCSLRRYCEPVLRKIQAFIALVHWRREKERASSNTFVYNFITWTGVEKL